MKRRRTSQLRVPGTSPTLRKATSDWRATMATRDELEIAVETKQDELATLKKSLDKATEAHRVAEIVYREALEDADGGQESIDGTTKTTTKPS